VEEYKQNTYQAYFSYYQYPRFSALLTAITLVSGPRSLNDILHNAYWTTPRC